MSTADGGATTPSRWRIGRIVRAPKTAELIASNLRRKIVRGDLTAGETLPSEVDLMDQYGVSRPTLREAFRILESETLLDIRRGSRGGAQVMRPDSMVAARYVGLLLQLKGTTIDDVYQARMVSEPICARLLAERRVDQDIIDLRAVVGELRDLVQASVEELPGPGKWAELTQRFRGLVLQRCGNKTLATQSAVLQEIVATHVYLRVTQNFDPTDTPEQFQQVIRAYDKLIRLVQRGEPDAAERHWRRHMEEAGKHLLRGEQRNKPVVDLFA